MVIVEAMSWGLPIVATRVGGIPEIITDGVNGLLVPPGDARALAEAVRLLCQDADLRERLGAEARRRWEQMPRWEEIEHQFCEIVRQAARS